MWLSSTAQQAIHAVLCIASGGRPGGARLQVDEIAAALDCPRNYLSKTLHLLVRAGVLRSARGPKGGFQLSAPPQKLTLAQVIAPFEPMSGRRCLIGRPQCSDGHPCILHERWSSVTAPVEAFLMMTTVADILGGSPHASDAARGLIGSMRLSTGRKSYGSVTH